MHGLLNLNSKYLLTFLLFLIVERVEMDSLVRMGNGDYIDGESQDEEDESTRGSDFGWDTDEENRMLSDRSDVGDGVDDMEE